MRKGEVKVKEGREVGKGEVTWLGKGNLDKSVCFNYR